MGERPRSDQPFVALFRDEYPFVVRVAYLMLGDRAAAEDVAQEAFARLYARWRRISSYDRPGAWVRRVAIRLAERARGGREVPTDREMRSPSQIAPHRELMESLLRLPAMQRAAVILRYLEERPIPEVAAILGCAEPTARVHLHRGRNRLREILQEVSDVDG